MLNGRGGSQGARSAPHGLCRLVGWAQAYGTISRVGVEGVGAYGAGLTAISGPPATRSSRSSRSSANRQTRRRNGKSDSVDAEAPARARLVGEASGIPKAGVGGRRSVPCGWPGVLRSRAAPRPPPTRRADYQRTRRVPHRAARPAHRGPGRPRSKLPAQEKMSDPLWGDQTRPCASSPAGDQTLAGEIGR